MARQRAREQGRGKGTGTRRERQWEQGYGKRHMGKEKAGVALSGFLPDLTCFVANGVARVPQPKRLGVQVPEGAIGLGAQAAERKL